MREERSTAVDGQPVTDVDAVPFACVLRFVWVISAIAVVLVAGCEHRGRETFRIGTDVDAGTLDPRLMRDTTAYRVVNLLYDGLVQLDPSLQPLPGLAARWDHPDPTTWVFHLRPGVTFHDGQPLSADDVVFTLESIRDPALNAPLRSLYRPIRHVEATDDLTVTLTLDRPYAPLPAYLDLGIVPRDAADDLGTHPVGTGPYRMSRWDPGRAIVLEANPDYWDGMPTLGPIELVVVPDNTARAQAFEAGDLDLIQSPLSPQDIRRLQEDPRVARHVDTGLAITYLNFNTARPLLGDPRVRRALSMLIDQATILEQIFERTDRAASSVLLPSWSAYTPDIVQPGFDPAGAASILDELGWKDTDADGIRDRDGTPLSFELGTHGEDQNRVQTVEFLQHAFAIHGIDARIAVSDWPSFSVRRDAGDYDVILLGWTQLVDPDRLLFDQLHSTGGLNWGRYRNERLDDRLESGRSATQVEERDAAYRDAARIIATEVPYYALSYQGYQVFHDPSLEGFEPDARGMLRSLRRVTRVARPGDRR